MTKQTKVSVAGGLNGGAWGLVFSQIMSMAVIGHPPLFMWVFLGVALVFVVAAILFRISALRDPT